MLISGGAHSVSAIESRVFELLERAGVFLVGGVLVGSHAFNIFGNMLGVKWESETSRTHDVDIASHARMLIGLQDKPITLQQALMESKLGFLEVPALDRKSPSTTFRLRGKQLSVDILTPMPGKTSSKPVHIKALNSYAEPVRFLDYLLDDIQPAVIVAKAGILVNVPSPARYAFHKLATAQRRVVAIQTKGLKDITQAKQLINVLISDRPGDLLVAWEAASQQPKKFVEQLKHGIKKLPVQTRNDLSNLVSI